MSNAKELTADIFARKKLVFTLFLFWMISRIADAASTYKLLESSGWNVEIEANPVARFLFIRIGVEAGIAINLIYSAIAFFVILFVGWYFLLKIVPRSVSPKASVTVFLVLLCLWSLASFVDNTWNIDVFFAQELYSSPLGVYATTYLVLTGGALLVMLATVLISNRRKTP